MLTHISISNYTIVTALEMEFAAGMTVITGETGAGKSIMLDALGLCLGDRADPKTVRPGCERAEINASFDIAAIPDARTWLAARDLDDPAEVILRRVVTAEGRSRAYINGSPSTLQDCAELGALLIDIHSQHAHQSLLRKPVQRELLDAYAGHLPLARALEQTASDWLRGERELALLTGARDEQTARAQLLAYQAEELDQLDLQGGELAALEEEQQLLENAEQILQSAHAAVELCEAHGDGARQALQLLRPELHVTAAANSARELLDSAAIQLSEARDELRHYIDSVEIDPARLTQVQERLESIYDVARKHRVKPEAVGELAANLREELQGLADGGQRIEQLRAAGEALAGQYRADAAKLSKQRARAGKKLVAEAARILGSLAMEQCRLEVALRPRECANPHPHGSEDVEFLISTNPGSPTQPLGKIASGGELSRVSLAIQVVTARTGAVPSMVFDEVDVGIGGAVAEVVGRLLRTLSARAQVLCVTHLPQVAAQGHQHLQVSKTSSADSVETTLSRLDGDAKTREIARMLGGVKITEQSLAHAREMIEGV
jgi:DNA repair protein RecN (Recombination protein N)